MNEQKFDFGWSRLWMNGYWIMGAICCGVSIMLILYFKSSIIQVLSVPLLLLAINLFMGNILWRTSKKTDYMTLPFVDLFSSDNDLILDAGCGAGRTTIALSKVMKNSRIISLDRFDSNYIEKGGVALLEKNIKVAGIADRVQVARGDVTGLKMQDAAIDTVVSAYMMDHIGKKQLIGLKELFRVLKPGGKFLLIVLVPGLTTFAIGNLFCLKLTSRKKWKSYFQQIGFKLREEGAINGGIFFLLQK